MIQIHINPARVDKVLVISESHIEEDFDLATWQAIRPLIEKIDRRLRRIVKDVSDSPSDLQRQAGGER
jgi:hypothetical protein